MKDKFLSTLKKRLTCYTECFTDLGKLNLTTMLEPIFTTAPAATKNEARFLSGQNLLKIIGLHTTI
jgi:hypothetical protein